MKELLIDQIIKEAIKQTYKPSYIPISRVVNKAPGIAKMSLNESNKYLFNESTVDDENAKIAFNKVLSKLPFINIDSWKIIVEDLNKNSLKDAIQKASVCYRIALIKFVKSYSKQELIEYANNNQKQYVYTSKYWHELNNDLLNEFLKNAALRLGIPEATAREYKWLKDSHKQFISDVFYEIEKTKGVSYLNLNNTLLKITEAKGLEIINHDPKVFQTYLLDYNYEPNNINQDWLNFINTVIPDKDTQKTLQQSLGYLFIKDLKLEKMFILYGNGANGKSVVFEVIKGILDKSLITHNTLTDLCTHNSTGTYFKQYLDGKLINYASDITLKGIDAASFKALVSGEPMNVRQIGYKPFLMEDYAKLIFNANKLDDATVENTEGFFRRIIIIPFEITISKDKRDKHLHEKLLKNKSGIINWILEGIKEVRKNQEIYESQKCKDVVENFRITASPIRTFIEDKKIEKTDENNGECGFSFKNMYKEYEIFCKEQNEKCLPNRNFNAELKQLGFKEKRKKDGYYWYAKKETASKDTPRLDPQILEILNS